MPHIGDSYSQCADRFAISENTFRFAIADGVGDSFFPDVWSELVCKDFVNNVDEFVDETTFLLREQNLISCWNDIVENKRSNLTDNEKFLVELSKGKCAFAACTFVGLSIDNKTWHCKALGDSYLFVLDKDYNIIKSVASQNGAGFTSYPEYFASEHGKNNGTIFSDSGDVSEVAYFVLLTDAISDWFIQANPDKRKQLVNVKNLDSFRSVIDSERTSEKMKDDDTTAVIIRVSQDNDENIQVEEIFNTDINQLIKEETDNTRQEFTHQMDEDSPISKETPPDDIRTGNAAVKPQTKSKEISLKEHLLQNTQPIIEEVNKLIEYINHFDFCHCGNNKTFDKIKNKFQNVKNELNSIKKKLDKIV